MLRRTSVALLVVAVFVLPATAHAVPPTLLSVGHESGVPVATWSLSPTSVSGYIEVARAPTTHPPGTPDAGRFYPQDWAAGGPLNTNQTSWRGPFPLSPGTYYVHVSSCPNTVSLCSLFTGEWSNILSFSVPEPPRPVFQPGPFPSLPGGDLADEPIDEEPLPQPKCPARGRYRGKTSQGERICFSLASSRKRVTRLEVNYKADCDYGTQEGWVRIRSIGVGRKGKLRGSSTSLTLEGRIIGRKARGTLRAGSGNPDIGECDSGLVRWAARRG